MLRRDAEVERELPIARGDEMPQHRAELRAAVERLVCLPHDRHVGKREEHLAVTARRGTDEPPLLHIAQMILAHVLVALEELTLRDRS